MYFWITVSSTNRICKVERSSAHPETLKMLQYLINLVQGRILKDSLRQCMALKIAIIR